MCVCVCVCAKCVSTYCISKFPSVWSSLFTVNMAALGTFVSLVMEILHTIKPKHNKGVAFAIVVRNK